MDRYYYDTKEDVLKLLSEALPPEGDYFSTTDMLDHFRIVYEGYVPFIFVDLSRVTTMGVLKAWMASHDENVPVINSSLFIAEDITDEYGVQKWIEVAIICEDDGRLISMHMKQEDADAMGIREVERIYEDAKFDD